MYLYLKNFSISFKFLIIKTYVNSLVDGYINIMSEKHMYVSTQTYVHVSNPTIPVIYVVNSDENAFFI